MDLIFESIFVGFGIYSIFLSLSRKRLESWDNQFLRNIDKVASGIFSIGGILFIGYWLFDVLMAFSLAADEQEKYGIRNRLFGPYWFGFWHQPILYLISTQALWINKIRRNSPIRFLIGLLMLISFEKLIRIITSLHRDFLPSSWSIPVSDTLVNWLIYLGIFILMVGITYLICLKVINRKAT